MLRGCERTRSLPLNRSATAFAHQSSDAATRRRVWELGEDPYPVPVKRHRGEPGHTRDTRTHKGTRTTQTNLTTIQTHQQHATRTSARRPIKPRPTQEPQARSRPPPAADSEEATPSEPDPASTRRGRRADVRVACCWWVWMVVRFVCVVRVPLCVRVSRVCPGSPRLPPVSFYR